MKVQRLQNRTAHPAARPSAPDLRALAHDELLRAAGGLGWDTRGLSGVHIADI